MDKIHQAWGWVSKNGVTRRAFLVTLAGTVIAALVPRLTSAQMTSARITSEDLLEGEAVEGIGPSCTLVAKYARYPMISEYGEDEDAILNPFDAVTRTGEFLYKTRTWAKDGELDENLLGPVRIVEPGQSFQIIVKNELFGK